jgi:arginyl-tRNA synthetase
MQITEFIKSLISEAVEPLDLGFPLPNIHIERPAQLSHGDYSTPLALALYKLGSKQNDLQFANPRSLAEAIVTQLTNNLQKNDAAYVIKSITIAGPGFINFTLSDRFFLEETYNSILTQEELFKSPKQAQSIIIEYISPNTNKPLHIGHVRNAALGSTMGRILEKLGWNVDLAIINNDRGLHITKSMWAYLMLGKKSQQTGLSAQPATDQLTNWQAVLEDWILHKNEWLTPQDMPDERMRKPDHFVGFWYQKGDTFAEDTTIQGVWSQMLQAWEGKDLPYHAQVRKLWAYLNEYFYAGFLETTAVLDASFTPEEINYESQIYEAGKEIVLKAADAGVFEKLPDGAIKVNLEKYKLPDKILLRRDGTGIYMTFDIELTRRRAEKHIDKFVWVVGVDQKLYFQQLFAVAELLGYGNQEKFYHFAYGMVRLPEGKMSSRKGRVVYADDLLEMAQDTAREIMQQSGFAKELPPEEFESVSAAVGVGAIKWTMLAQDAQSEITFNIAESVNFTGFAGPYIQYTHARTHSIFKKAENGSIAVSFDALLNNKEYLNYQLNAEERDIFLNVNKYFDIVDKAAQEFAPHHLCVYLHELAQSFNTFYAHQKIVGENNMQTTVRLALTKAVQRILANGLTTLGITAVERM